MLSIDEGTTTSSKQLAEVMSTSSAGPPDSLRIKVYTRRWFMLLIFILFSSTNFVQGVHYALIENIMTRYYNVSALAIESTAFVPNAMYVLGCVPISFMVYVLDLRNSCMIAAVVSCIATWMKVYAVSPDRFALALIAQAIMGLCQIVILTTPVSLAAYWFGPNEVATATAVGSLGMVMGMAVFSLILPMVVHNHESIEEIGRDNYYFTLGVAIVSTVSVFLVVTFFRNEPCLPPSQSRALQKLKKKEEFHFVQPLLRVIKDKNYLLLWNAHGFIMGTASSIGTLFNRLFLLHFENSEMDVGKLSMVAVSSGIAGGIIVGIIQDKKKIFKLI